MEMNEGLFLYFNNCVCQMGEIHDDVFRQRGQNNFSIFFETRLVVLSVSPVKLT